MKRVSVLAIAAAFATSFASAGAQEAGAPGYARAEIKNTKGEVVGTTRLSSTPNGVLMAFDLKGLPEGQHAIHVHETGRCDAPDFKSAGGHLGSGSEHGYLDAQGAHAGDLPNIHLPKNGELKIEYLIDKTTLQSGPGALLDHDGAAIVIHAKADDYRSDPAGESGARIACGVVERTG